MLITDKFLKIYEDKIMLELFNKFNETFNKIAELENGEKEPFIKVLNSEFQFIIDKINIVLKTSEGTK